MAILIKFVGVGWIDAVLPPAAMGPIVALIGLVVLLMKDGGPLAGAFEQITNMFVDKSNELIQNAGK